MHSVKRHFQHRWGVIIVVLSILMLVLAACGSGGGSGQGGGATPTPSLTPSPTPVQVQQCGKVNVIGPHGTPSDPAAAQAAADCLWQAYQQQCRPATMTFTATSLDSGVVHIFTIGKKGSSCMITDEVQHYIAPNPPKTTATYVCASVTKTTAGLVFSSCGQDGVNGTVLVPTV
jgi:hypothetical protein